MTDEARRRKAAAERAVQAQYDLIALTVEQWRSSVEDCIPEFLDAVRSMEVEPTRKLFQRPFWLVYVPYERMGPGNSVDVRHTHIAVHPDGSWHLVHVRTSDGRSGYGPRTQRTHITRSRETSPHFYDARNVVSAREVRNAFVSRLS